LTTAGIEGTDEPSSNNLSHRFSIHHYVPLNICLEDFYSYSNLERMNCMGYTEIYTVWIKGRVTYAANQFADQARIISVQHEL